MKLDSKVTGGLAWAGLFVILAVPAADILSKPSQQRAGSVAASIDAVETGSVKPVQTAAIKAPVPAVRKAPAKVDVVDDYLASGKRLPSYISDAPGAVSRTETAPAATADAAVVKKPATTTLIVAPSVPQAAAVGPSGAPADDATMVTASVPTGQITPPQPYPASMRPVLTAATQPLIVDEDRVAGRDVTSPSIEYLEPMAPTPLVTSDELEEWNSGSLAEYLERRGLIGEGDEVSQSDYDEDGFFLDEGPNSDVRLIGPRNSGVRLIGRAGDGWSLF